MKITGFDINNPIQQVLSVAISAGRMPHAVILEGGSVSERMELAKKLAAALVCSEKADAPCGGCAHCIKSAADSHPDVLIYSVEDKPKAFKVDIVREIRNKAYIIPNEADRKVFILENSHTMGVEGQNAILKILEEPPSFVNFIMLCSSKSGFLPTVLSRATVYSLGETKAAADDSLPREKVIEAAKGIALGAAALEDIEIVKAAGVFEKDTKLLRAALPVIQEMFSAALRVKYSAAEENTEFGTVPQELSTRLSARALLNLVESIDEVLNALLLNANHNLTVTRLCTLLRRAVR